MIDSHAHLYLEEFDEDREAVIRRAREAGVKSIINIGIDLETTSQAIELAREHADFFASAGIHPQSPIDDLETALAGLRELILSHPEEVVAVGEIGLDYYWDTVPPEAQSGILQDQLDLAVELSLPVIFHCREAIGPLLKLLEARDKIPPGVFHCFEGGPAEAERGLALGFHISFAGNVTYKNAQRLQQAAAVVPLNRLLLETDSPYLPPHPHRGERNEPAYTALTRDFLAELLGIPPLEIDEAATVNTRRLFSLRG